MARLPSVTACRHCWGVLFSTTAALLAMTAGAQADQDFYRPRTTYGEIGILEMPSARTAPDGQLTFTASVLDGIQHYNLGFQILPWLEGSFRYSRIPKLLAGGLTEFDRSFGLKIRLVNESRHFPQISLGARDLLGTGIYSGEYLVASKQVDDFDLTLGMGWGRFAQRAAFANPLASLFSSFRTRDTNFGLGGTLSFGQFFHGPNVGLFGGVVWRTPIEGLNVLAEYSSDRYMLEAKTDTFKVHSPLNFGLSYHFFDVATVSAGWYYGNSYGLTLSISADPTTNVAPVRFEANLPQPVTRPDKGQIEALTVLLQRSAPIKPLPRDAAWIDFPQTPISEASTSLKATLVSTIQDVRDVEVIGRTVLIDAGAKRHGALTCNGYARIVSGVATTVDAVALSDVSDPSGNVTICRIAHYTDTGFPERLSASDTQADSGGSPEVDDPATVLAKVRGDVAAQSISVEGISLEPGMMWLYFDNEHYFSESAAAGRITRILMADLPASIEIFHLVSVRHGISLRDFTIARSAMERASSTSGSAVELGQAISLNMPPLNEPVLDRGQATSYPRLHWSIEPALTEGLFDPNRPLQVQLLAALNANVEVTPYLDVEGSVEANIYNNFNLNLPANSQLPHVRSDILEYYRHGINGIAKLDAVYRTRITRDVYAELKAGYLESMFAGVGGQVLWQPDGERIAVGADLYDVWQRSFDRLFGVQKYHVLTGHVSLYYASPWYDLNFNLHVGRYLAGDYGATIEVTRRFSTGVEIGAFATFTNVPFSVFGEGSFDKGILIRIPFEWGLPFHSRSSYDLLLRSLTRDGGQRLLDDDSLHDDLQSTSYGVLRRHLDDITNP